MSGMKTFGDMFGKEASVGSEGATFVKYLLGKRVLKKALQSGSPEIQKYLLARAGETLGEVLAHPRYLTRIEKMVRGLPIEMRHQFFYAAGAKSKPVSEMAETLERMMKAGRKGGRGVRKGLGEIEEEITKRPRTSATALAGAAALGSLLTYLLGKKDAVKIYSYKV